MSTLSNTDLTVADANITTLKDGSGNNPSTPANILAGTIKAWITFDGSSGSIGTGAASHNIASVTDNGTGDYTINIDTDFGSANWCATGICDGAGSNWGGLAFDAAKAAGTVRVQCWDEDKNGSGIFDSTDVSVMCIGVQ
jgi:hypothetical protein